MRSVILWLVAAFTCVVSATAFVPSSWNKQLHGRPRQQQAVFRATSEGSIEMDSEIKQGVNGKEKGFGKKKGQAKMQEEVVPEREPEKEPETPVAAAFAEPDTLSSSFYIPDEDEVRQLDDERYMQMAIDLVLDAGGERGATSAYPHVTAGAVLVSSDGRKLGEGRSDYKQNAIQACFQDAGVEATPLQEWCVTWPESASLRKDLQDATLYVTVEPSVERGGTALPSAVQLIVATAALQRVVIGCADPVPERALRGAAALHAAGLQVQCGGVLESDCRNLMTEYAALANGKLQRMARKHFARFGTPLGFLHCSVVDSENRQAFANNGNAFGTSFGGKTLSFRDFGAYEIAPPPEVIWVDAEGDDEEDTMDEAGMGEDDILSVDFEEEDWQGFMGNESPMMPWYEQVDAVVATFPRSGNGPTDDDSIRSRLKGLKWLATYGNELPAGVERILVLDATDLGDLPLDNDNDNLPKGVDVEAFWKAEGRKATRVLLRRGKHAQARAAAEAAAASAAAAATAAAAAAAAMESGDAAAAAQAALECQKAAQTATELIQRELAATQAIRSSLEKMGVVVDVLEGGEPVDIMKHLGTRNGLQTVVWRAGCWGQRGVDAILSGAFQWVSAHLAVDAVGGKFWQLMLAENAVQAACGPERKVKVFADQEDISLEYCDEPEADSDCALTIDGRPVRHIRLDCRVALVDEDRPREFVKLKTGTMDRAMLVEQAPWFL